MRFKKKHLTFMLLCFLLRHPALAQNHYSPVTQWGSSGKKEGQFREPRSISVGPDGSVYVGDVGNERIQRKFPSDSIKYWELGNVINGSHSEVLESVTIGIGANPEPSNGPIRVPRPGPFDLDAQAALLPHSVRKNIVLSPFSIVVDGSGNIYIADLNRIEVRKFAFGGSESGKYGNYGDAVGQYQEPSGITVDSMSNVYVLDTKLHKIIKFDEKGKFISEFGKEGGGNGEFSYPGGAVVDAFGNIYIADTGNKRIQKIDSKGIFLKAWGKGGHENGQFDKPMGITLDSLGRVFVADSGNSRVQVFDSEGKYLTQFGDRWKFKKPIGIAVDKEGFVYVADIELNSIQKWAPDQTKP